MRLFNRSYSSSPVRRLFWCALALLSLPLAAQAQNLTGSWNFRGYYVEAYGGLSTSFESEFESGTFTFTAGSNNNYTLRVVDQYGTEDISLQLIRTGNVYRGSFPPEQDGTSMNYQDVSITLVGDDYALLISDTRSEGTEAHLAQQIFGFESAVYVLSRNTFPTPTASTWTGEFAYRLTGLATTQGRPLFQETALESSISFSNNGGVTAMIDGTLMGMAQEGPGVWGTITEQLDGRFPEAAGFAFERHQLAQYFVAIPVSATEVAWCRSSAWIGAEGSYFVIYTGETVSGIATRDTRTPPAITRQPANVSVLTGGQAFISVEATGKPAPTYDWERSTDGGATWVSVMAAGLGGYTGATTATLVVEPSVLHNGDQFRAVVSNPAGSVTSAAVTTKVLAEATARLPNLSVRTTLAAAQTLTVGFVMNGGTKPLLLRAIGPGLAEYGVPGTMPDPSITFFNTSGVEVAGNDDWRAEEGELFGQLGAFPLPEGSKDAALRVSLSGGSTAQVRGTPGGVTLVEVYDIGDENTTRLANVSARNQVGTGDNILIAGFVVNGADPKNLLIRGIGPMLAKFGVPGVLNDPKLEVYSNRTGELIASNDNWKPALRPSFNTTGAFDLPDYSLDAALILTLPPGPYSVQLRGADGGTGEGLIEIYELP